VFGREAGRGVGRYTGRVNDPQVHQEPRGGGTIFDEIRRQMEEMLGGQRPPGPRVVVNQPEAGQRAQPNDHFGLAMTSVAAYWLLPIMAAKRRRRRMRTQ
jgi:hypothetical protein